MQFLDIIGRRGRATIGILAGVLVAGCAATGPQVTHHWVSQTNVAGNVYQNDVAACSNGEAEVQANSPEFAAYQACMNERGYALVAAADVGESGQE